MKVAANHPIRSTQSPEIAMLPRTHEWRTPMGISPNPLDRKFYKYMTADTAKKVLEKVSLRWASSALFNDPFDVQFDLRVEYDRERVIDQALQNIVDLYMGRRHMPRDANKLAQGIRWLQHNAPGLKEADLKAKFRESMNEGMDNAAKNMPKNHEEMRAILSKHKLLCFSEVYDNILMWAHYAKDHTGAVMEFSYIEKLDSAWGAAKPVRYRKVMPYLVNEEKLVKLLSGEGTIATPDLFEEAVYVKALDWAYEREWRLVGGWEHDKIEEFIPFEPEEMTAIYLGCRMSDADKKAIKELAAKKFLHAPIYAGEKSKSKFAVELSKL
jgi:hypothetical protein